MKQIEIESYETEHIHHLKNALFIMALFPLLVFGLVVVVLLLGNTRNYSGAQSISCTRTISSGDPGTQMNTMSSGQTLCLSAGNYTAKANGQYSRINVSGVTLTSVPGATANIVGAFEVRGSNNKFMNININGDGLPQGTFLIMSGTTGNQILSSDISSVSTNRGICIIVGEGGSTAANGPTNVLIEGNKIHNCGGRENDQGVYLNSSRNGIIRNNYIYDNPDFAIQFYRTAQNNIVEYNTMDNNKRGVTISSEAGYTPSSNNILRNNIITNSKGNIILLSGAQSSYAGYNVDYYYGGGAGTGNQVTGNCTFGAKSGEIRVAPSGISYSGNIVGNPNYVNAGAKNFTLNSGSSCAGKGVQVAAAPAPTPTPTPTPTPAPSPTPTPTPTPSPSPSPSTGGSTGGGSSSTNSSGTTAVVKVPTNIIPDQQGNISIDVTGDGVEDTVKDLNQDGVIDPSTELISEHIPELGQGQGSEEKITQNAGPVTEVDVPFSDTKITVPNVVGYGFIASQVASAIGLIGYVFLARFRRST